jgi:hypothetical protein
MQRFFFRSLLFISCGLATGCGYHPAFSTVASERLGVVAGTVLVPDSGTLAAVIAGARSELERTGVLGPEATYPRLEVDVLRVDEVSSGVTAAGASPIARGMGVAVVGRGRVVREPGAAPESDTGDLRRTSFLAGDSDPRVDSTLYDAALRGAAERVGRDVAKAALGIPEPADESL